MMRLSSGGRPPAPMPRLITRLAILAGAPVLLGAISSPLPLDAATIPSAGTEVRVLLLEAPQVRVDPLGGRLQVRDGSARPLLALPSGQGLTLTVAGATGAISLEGLPAGSLPALSGGRELWLEVVSDRTVAEPPAGGLTADGQEAVLQVQKRPYRGRLQVLLEAGQLRIINHLALEAYLASVVGSEMPASWPQQALRAQAVAARTYALKELRPAEPFDLRATVASQVYRGLEAETASTREAVQATRSQVLTYGGELIQAVFHSSSGEATEDSGAVWSRQLPYLVSVPDFDRSSPVSSWTLRFTSSQLSQFFPDTGGVTRFEVLALSASGRLRQVRVEGPRGQRLYSGADLRRILGLRSTLVRFEPIALAPAAGSGLAPTSAPSASGPAIRPDSGSATSPSSDTGSPSAPAPRPTSGATSAVGSARQAALALAPAATVAQEAPALPPLPPIPAAGRSVSPPLQPPSGWVLKGRGFGHGVGMSQWGAYGLASQGLDYTRILQHYYRGTNLITLPGAMQAAVSSRQSDVATGSGVSVGRP